MLSDPRHPSRSAYALYSTSTSLPGPNCSQVQSKALDEQLPGSQPAAWSRNGAVVTPLPHEQPLPMPLKAPPGKPPGATSSAGNSAQHPTPQQHHEQLVQHTYAAAAQQYSDVPGEHGLEVPAQLDPGMPAQLGSDVQGQSVLPMMEPAAQHYHHIPAQPSLKEAHVRQCQQEVQQQHVICESSSLRETWPQPSRQETSANLAPEQSRECCNPRVLDGSVQECVESLNPNSAGAAARNCRQETASALASKGAAGAVEPASSESTTGYHIRAHSEGGDDETSMKLPEAFLDDQNADTALVGTHFSTGARPSKLPGGQPQDAATSKAEAAAAAAKEEGPRGIQLQAFSHGLITASGQHQAPAHADIRHAAAADPEAAHLEDCQSHALSTRHCGNEGLELHQRASAAISGGQSGNSRTVSKPCTWGWDPEILPILQDHAATLAELNGRARPASGVQSAQKKQGACAVM